MSRLGAFAFVGAVGFIVQVAVLAALVHVAGWPYPIATACGVEAAVLHNFTWHQRWTWSERQNSNLVARLARYHAGAATASLLGNLVFTTLWVEIAGLHPVAANVIAVATMGAVNFIIADRWVFARGPLVCAAGLVLLPAAAGAQPSPAAERAWDEHIRKAESALAPNRPLLEGLEPQGETLRIPGGTIHRWRGAVVLPGVTLDAVLHGLLHPGTPPPQEEVLEARVLSRRGDALRVYLKLIRTAVVTVTYDTEHEVEFTRHSPTLATSTSVATRIAEADGGDRGFLWRLNSYWRYVAVDGGVRVELESWSLSRSVPTVLRPIAAPIITRIARESLTKTLTALREHFSRPDPLTRRTAQRGPRREPALS